MRFTPHTWRYLLPLMLLPAAVLIILALHQARVEGDDMRTVVSQPDAVSVDGAELLLQFVGIEESERQAQHQVNALFE